MALPTTIERMTVRLQRIAKLSSSDVAAINALPMTIRDYPAGSDIVREGDKPIHCCAVLDGVTCRYKVINDGRRQILAFNIPGDIPDLQSLHLDVMDHSLGTLTPTRLAFIPHHHILALCAEQPSIGAALWRATLIDGAGFRAWITGIGRMTARARLAHILCELLLRLDAVGLADGFAYKLPLTQSELGDALGLSVVHVNRILQDLRGEGVIALDRRTVTIQNWDELRRIGQFDPTYLYLVPPR